MEIFMILFIFLLGTIIGSFLNVVIYRLNTGKSIVFGRSICMSCDKELRWYELIPVFSFLIQRGKCRRCKTRISYQYPLVEILFGLVFTLILIKFLPLLYVSVWVYFLYACIYTIIFSLLIVIVFYDIRHKIIPAKLALTFILISFFLIFINPYTGSSSIFVLPNIYSIIAGPLIALPFVLLWLFSKGRLMGLGDGKLILGIGWLMGLSQGLFAVVLAFWLGALISLIMMIFSKKKMNMKSQIPFAPFLIVSVFITFLFNLDIFSLARIFN